MFKWFWTVFSLGAPDMTTEKFQRLMWHILNHCYGAHNLPDDARVVRRDQKDHDKNLDRVKQKFEEDGLTLNYVYAKCVIGADSMIYMGELLTGDGLQVS